MSAKSGSKRSKRMLRSEVPEEFSDVESVHTSDMDSDSDSDSDVESSDSADEEDSEDDEDEDEEDEESPVRKVDVARRILFGQTEELLGRDFLALSKAAEGEEDDESQKLKHAT